MRNIALFLALTSLSAATALAGSEVYVGIRTDGKNGSGTATDVFNANTQETFDALFAGFGPNTTIHLGPGAYHTKGQASFMVKPYWKIRGAGYEATKIIQDKIGKIGCIVFSGVADGVEIEDLSVDCGLQNQQVVNGKIKANASAIGIFGSHLAVRRCLFKNYGSPYDADTNENFAVFIGSPAPASGENLIAEDCIFTGMPLLPGGQVVFSSVLTLAGGPSKNDLRAGNWARGVVARRNHFTGCHYACHGITVDGSQGAMIVNNVFEHFMGTCVHQDTWPMRDQIIADNIMSDVNQGMHLTCDDMNNFQIRGNIILINDGYDLKDIVGGVAHTDIDHSLAIGNKIRIRGAKLAGGAVMPERDVFVVSTPTRFSFAYCARPTARARRATTPSAGSSSPFTTRAACAPSPRPSWSLAATGRRIPRRISTSTAT